MTLKKRLKSSKKKMKNLKKRMKIINFKIIIMKKKKKKIKDQLILLVNLQDLKYQEYQEIIIKK